MSGQGDKGIRWDWDGARRIGPFVLGQPLDDSVVRELGITHEQVVDYAARKGMSVEEVERWLATHLAEERPATAV